MKESEKMFKHLMENSVIISDNIANSGKKETKRWLKNFIKELDAGVTGYLKEKHWKFLRIDHMKGLSEDHYFRIRADYKGEEVWMIEAGGKKIAVSDDGRGGPAFVDKSYFEKQILRAKKKLKRLKESAQLVDDWSGVLAREY